MRRSSDYGLTSLSTKYVASELHGELLTLRFGD